MKIQYYQLDAFTETPFGGNPAGVVPLISKQGETGTFPNLTEEDMKKIAREINCSETAFIFPAEDPKAAFKVRFFTPTEEVDLCGHATIAAFWLLGTEGYIKPDTPQKTVTQETKAGVLPVALYTDTKKQLKNIMMDMAQPEFKPSPLTQPEIAEILGASADSIKIPQNPNIKPMIVSTGLPDLLVPIKDLNTLKQLSPNMDRLASISREHGFISIHAFTFETVSPESTVHCRDFAPSVGINEESATGTANGALGAYLTAFGLIPTQAPTTTIICEQGHVMGRPSTIVVEIDIDTTDKPSLKSVKVGGRAVKVMEGFLYL